MEFYFDRSFFKKESLFMQKTDRTAGRIEFLTKREAVKALRYAKQVFSYHTLCPNSSGGTDLFYSNNKNEFSELIGLTRLVEKGDIDAIRKTGRILGYPDCCIDAYIEDQLYLTVNTGLNWFIRRIQKNAPFDIRMNPFDSLIRHIPCSLDCRKTMRLLDLYSEIWGSRRASQDGVSYITPLPYNISNTDGRCILDYATIRISDRKGNRLYYKPLYTSGNPDIFSEFGTANNMLISNGNISLYIDDTLISRFSLRFFVWSNEFLPLRGFYKNLFLSSFTARIIGLNSGSSFYRDERYIEIMPFVESTVATLLSKERYIALDEKVTLINNMILLPLRIMESNINLILQFNEDTENYYIRGKRLSLSIQGKEFGNIEDRRQFLQRLLDKIETNIIP